jgi:hypothetical protein
MHQLATGELVGTVKVGVEVEVEVECIVFTLTKIHSE